MIETRILRSIAQRPEAFSCAPDAHMASYPIADKVILSYGIDVLRDIIIENDLKAPEEVYLSVVICPLEGPGLQILARASTGSSLERQSLEALKASKNFDAIAQALKASARPGEIGHFEISAPGRISAHDRLALRKRLDTFNCLGD
jgi:hypothetical protein